MKSPTSYRRRRSKWDLSIETEKPEHRYVEIERTIKKFTADVVERCMFCGCERHSTKIGTKIIRSHYKRSSMTYNTSPLCWGAKNPV
jgi:hypothetical protein